MSRSDVEKVIREEVKAKGLPDAFADALIANAGAESNFNFQARQKLGKKATATAKRLQQTQPLSEFLASKKGGKGYGLFQLDTSTKNAYAKYLKDNEFTDSIRSQVRFAIEDSTSGIAFGNKNASNFLNKVNTLDREALTVAFAEDYEKRSSINETEQNRRLKYLPKKVSEAIPVAARSEKKEDLAPVVEEGTTDMQETVEQEQYDEAAKAADRDEQLQQAEALKTQTTKAVPIQDQEQVAPPKEEKQSSFFDFMKGINLFGQDEKNPEVVKRKKELLLKDLDRFIKPTVTSEPIQTGETEMRQGGLFDEGGSVDEVSGNEVPSGSLKEEVRDDIPAKLSEGEFVFPADVVRYIGLEKLMRLRQQAKAGLKMMEQMGQMGNADEAVIPDDVPFSIDDLELEDDGVLEFQTGGFVPGQGFPSIPPGIPTPQQQVAGISGLMPSQFNPANPSVGMPAPFAPPPIPQQGFVPTAQANVPTLQPPGTLPEFGDLIPSPEGKFDELREYEGPNGEKMSIPFVDGKPIYPIPEGYTEVKTDIVKPPTTEVPTAQVESAVESGDEGSRAQEEDEAMYGPGGARVALGGELYTGPTKFVGEGVRARQFSGSVVGATKVGVSFDTPTKGLFGIPTLTELASLGVNLATGKGIPEGTTATFTLNGQRVKLSAEKYNAIKAANFRGPEAEMALKQLNQKSEMNAREKEDRVAEAKDDREKVDSRIEAAAKRLGVSVEGKSRKQVQRDVLKAATARGQSNKIERQLLESAKIEATKFGIDTKGKNRATLEKEVNDAIIATAQANAARRQQQASKYSDTGYYESDKGEGRDDYSFEDYSDNVASGSEDRSYGASYDADVLGLDE